MTMSLEEQRETYDLKINELNITLDKYQTELVSLNAKVLERDTRLAQKADVEKQLELWKGHHDSMENSKRELQEQLEALKR